MLLVVAIALGLVARSESSRASTAGPTPVATTLPAQPPLASDPTLLAGDLAADEHALRDPSSSEADVLFPIGYAETQPVPVADYSAAHPQ
ncbi:hypothetical protein AWC15_22130 [Mycobacterium lacus]|nr:hypothetical protein AWC15_22130 [Mycobacterium lacus]